MHAICAICHRRPRRDGPFLRCATASCPAASAVHAVSRWNLVQWQRRLRASRRDRASSATTAQATGQRSLFAS